MSTCTWVVDWAKRERCGAPAVCEYVIRLDGDVQRSTLCSTHLREVAAWPDRLGVLHFQAASVTLLRDGVAVQFGRNALLRETAERMAADYRERPVTDAINRDLIPSPMRDHFPEYAGLAPVASIQVEQEPEPSEQAALDAEVASLELVDAKAETTWDGGHPNPFANVRAEVERSYLPVGLGPLPPDCFRRPKS